MINIVVADDDLVAREMYKIKLVQAGMAVYEAGDGVQALKEIKKTHPDLVILDIMLPRMNGLDVLKLIRADREMSKMPVIILTALSQDFGVNGGLSQKADAYLSKSMTMPKDLLDKVISLLSSRGLITR